MITKKLKLINGEIKLYRDKLDNTHIDHIEFNSKNNIDRYEIYTVFNNGKEYTIGDVSDNGFISDFFIVNNEIYVRYANVLKTLTDIKLKKNCLKLN